MSQLGICFCRGAPPLQLESCVLALCVLREVRVAEELHFPNTCIYVSVLASLWSIEEVLGFEGLLENSRLLGY